MRKYIKPMMIGEVFAANEYIAACNSVVCDVSAANAVERNWIVKVPGHWEGWHWIPGYTSNNYEQGQTHASGACGSLGNYYVIDNNGDGKFDGMVEISSDLGRLNCSIFTDADYDTAADWSSIATGQTIYWTTSKGNRVWHHQGSVGVADPNHPNRS